MKKLFVTGTALAALVSLPLSNAHADITTVDNGTLTTIYGTGNPNTWDSIKTYSGTDGNLQLALNSHINPNNGVENLDFSVNVDPANAGGITLASTGYSYILTASGSTTTLNLAVFGDNQYGNSSTANGAGAKEIFALGSLSNTIFQNSEPVTGPFFSLDSYFGVSGPTTFTLEVLDANNDIVGSDTLGVAPVPEPTTIFAGAMMLLPMGIGAIRMARKNRAA